MNFKTVFQLSRLGGHKKKKSNPGANTGIGVTTDIKLTVACWSGEGYFTREPKGNTVEETTSQDHLASVQLAYRLGRYSPLE